MTETGLINYSLLTQRRKCDEIIHVSRMRSGSIICYSMPIITTRLPVVWHEEEQFNYGA